MSSDAIDTATPRPGRPEAAAKIWNWRCGEEQRRARALRKAHRQGLLRGGAALLLAGLLAYVGWFVVTGVATALGLLTLAAAYLSPHGLHQRLDRLFLALIQGVGILVGWIVLTPVYLLVFLPFGRLTRRGRRDPLHRRFEPEAESYWRERQPDRDRAARHRRQF